MNDSAPLGITYYFIQEVINYFFNGKDRRNIENGEVWETIRRSPHRKMTSTGNFTLHQLTEVTKQLNSSKIFLAFSLTE